MKTEELVLKELTSMGFEPTQVGDMGYAFNYEELTFLFITDDDDAFLRFAIPNMFEVTDDNRTFVLEAINQTSLSLKYSKMCITSDAYVWAMYEHRLNSTEDITNLLEHIILVLFITYDIFYKSVSGEDVMSGNDADDDTDDDTDEKGDVLVDEENDDSKEDVYTEEEIDALLQEYMDAIEKKEQK